MKFGDIVTVTLDADKYGEQQALVIGSPAYAKDRAVLMVASPTFAGMPINRVWCKPFSEGHELEAQALRDAYEAKYPGSLLPEQPHEAALACAGRCLQAASICPPRSAATGESYSNEGR